MNDDERQRALQAQLMILLELKGESQGAGGNRFSKLYSLYNGFMLGHFLIGSSLEFTRKTPGKIAEQVYRTNEFLREIGADPRLEDNPPQFGTPAFQETVLGRIVPGVAAVSTDVAEFALLSVQLMFYGHMVHFEPDTVDMFRAEIERLSTKHELPDVDFPAMVPPLYEDDDVPVRIDDVLNLAHRYLERAVDGLDIEPDTAFVVMPFNEPYAGRFHTLYRPALELAGFRAFRAWGGLSDERYCDMLLALIAKVGFVWTDVSGMNLNVMYELGAAHAGNRQAIIVTEKTSRSSPEEFGIPANIGHDVVARYSPDDEGWPEHDVVGLALTVAAMRAAQERYGRHRVTREQVGEMMDDAAQRVKEGLQEPS